MKANPEKCHLLTSKKDTLSINVKENAIISTQSVKLLGVDIDYKLNFREHISKLCTKASQKLNALIRISSFMSIEKRRILMKHL